MTNVLILQSGGPTAAINATLAGVIQQAQLCDEIGHIYGAQHGIKGVLEERIVNLEESMASPEAMEQLIHTPGAALGSCRKKLVDPTQDPADYQQVFAVLRKWGVGYMVCIGGNDSMDTVVKLSDYAKRQGITDIVVVGAPKTIDNDLAVMDHSPGFASAARYVATTFAELWQDCNVYDIPAVTIVEVMGRNVGWLTAASCLARKRCPAPHYIYLPEVAFSVEQFLSDVKEQLAQYPAVLVAVSEGIRDAEGKLIGESNTSCGVDEFGHTVVTGVAGALSRLVQQHVGCKVRAIELSLLQRCAGHVASGVDLYEARMLGAKAMVNALQGHAGTVSIISRASNHPYRVEYRSILASEVANYEKAVPLDWIHPNGNNVTKSMFEYLEPLITQEGEPLYTQGLPNHISFLT